MSDNSNIHEMLSPEDQAKRDAVIEVDKVFDKILKLLKVGRSKKINPKSKKDREWRDEFVAKVRVIFENLFNVSCWSDHSNMAEGSIALHSELKNELKDAVLEPRLIYFHFYFGKRKAYIEPENSGGKNKILSKNIYGKDSEVLDLIKKKMKEAGSYKLHPVSTGSGSSRRFNFPITYEDIDL